MENCELSDSTSSNNSNSNKIKIPKTKKCVRDAVQKYEHNLKEKNPDQYNKRLQYHREYYKMNKDKLKQYNEMMEKLNMYENMKQISI